MTDLQKAAYDFQMAVVRFATHRALERMRLDDYLCNRLQGQRPVPGMLYWPALTSGYHMAYLVLDVDADGAEVCPVFDLPVLENDYYDILDFNYPAMIPFTWEGWGRPIAHINAREWFDMKQVRSWRVVGLLPEWKIKVIRLFPWKAMRGEPSLPTYWPERPPEPDGD